MSIQCLLHPQEWLTNPPKWAALCGVGPRFTSTAELPGDLITMQFVWHPYGWLTNPPKWTAICGVTLPALRNIIVTAFEVSPCLGGGLLPSCLRVWHVFCCFLLYRDTGYLTQHVSNRRIEGGLV